MNTRTLQRRLDRLEHSRHTSRSHVRAFPAWLEPEIDGHGWAASNVINIDSADWRYDTLPAQRVFHGNLTARFKGYSGPIGSGKSHALIYEALLLSRLNPGLLGLIAAPTYRMLQDSTQRAFFEVLAVEGIDHVFRKQDNRLRFTSNGSEIIFRTLENPERLRGPNLAWFAVDELTYAREEAWTRLLGRLRHPQARRLCGCGVWTPKGYDWVHRRFVEQSSPDYHLVRATPKENIHLPGDFYEQLKDSYNELFYRQEALGEYLDIFGGQAFHAFSDANVEPVVCDPNLSLCWALDFNVDPMCSVICQVEEWKRTPWATASHETRKHLRVLDELALPNSNTVEAAEAFIDRVGKLHELPNPVVIRIYGDASGNSRSSKSTRTDYELIRDVFRGQSRFQITLHQNKANPIVRDRVNTMNHALRSAAENRSITIDPRCRELIQDLRQVRWKRDAAGNTTGELDKSDPGRTHVSDALSYLVCKEFGLRGTVGAGKGILQ